jgi:hypothetical protein
MSKRLGATLIGAGLPGLLAAFAGGGLFRRRRQSDLK